MNYSITGSPIVFDLPGVGTRVITTDASQAIIVDRRNAVSLIRERSIIFSPLADLLGLYRYLNVGANLKAQIMAIGEHGGMLAPRSNGCEWTAKGALDVSTISIETCPAKVQAELCPDVFYNCWEGIFGGGNGVVDFEANSASFQLLQQIFEVVADGVSTSFVQSAYYNNDSRLDANQSKFHPDVYSQLKAFSCKGFMPQLTESRTVTIPNTDVNSNGEYTGDPVLLFNQLITSAPNWLRTAVMTGVARELGQIPAIYVSSNVFNAYMAYMAASNTEIGFNAFLRGGDNSLAPFNIPNALPFNGIPVVVHPVFDMFAGQLGPTTCALLAAPRSFGLALDIDPTETSDFGLIMERPTTIRNAGKVSMAAYFRMGMGLDANGISFAIKI